MCNVKLRGERKRRLLGCTVSSTVALQQEGSGYKSLDLQVLPKNKAVSLIGLSKFPSGMSVCA